MANLQTELEQKQQDAIAATTAASEATAFMNFFHRHPRLNMRANEELFRAFISPMVLDEESLEASLASDNLRSQLAHLSEARATERIERQDRASIEARIAEVGTNNKRLMGMSKDELKAEVQANHVAVHPAITLTQTRAELLSMKKEDFRRLIHFPTGQKRPGYQEAVDAILAGR